MKPQKKQKKEEEKKRLSGRSSETVKKWKDSKRKNGRGERKQEKSRLKAMPLENWNEQKPNEQQNGQPQGNVSQTIQLKQYFVTSSAEKEKTSISPQKPRAFFILQTCAAKAREEFQEKTGLIPSFCCQTAESEFVKEDLTKRDFWEEGRNWEVIGFSSQKTEESEAVRRYFETKAEGELVKEAKRRLKIQSTENMSQEQVAEFHAVLSSLREEKKLTILNDLWLIEED